LAGFEAGGVVIAVEETTIVQGERVRAAAAGARALAYRRFLHQPMRHVLLLVQHSGRVQPFPRALGFTRVDAKADVEVILERAKEKYPEAKPRIISDNGPQFIARDFKEFIRISGMTHVRTSPSYPQSNGKLERWHESLKSECIRPRTPLSLQVAKRLIQQYVDRYNNVRLHSAIGYVTPKDMLAGRQVEIHTERDRKLEAARQQRQSRRQQAA
jgi:hypothetical protein